MTLKFDVAMEHHRSKWAICLPICLCLALSCGQKREKPPSILLISIDTLRADHVGYHGYERDTTPFLDRLAEESLVFERAHSAASWTLSSHMTMLTGLYPSQHGIIEDGIALNEEVPLLAERLRDEGYQTLALYRPGWIHERFGFDRGFDDFEGHKNAEEAEEHLKEAFELLNPARPYFLFLHLFDVHTAPFLEGENRLYRVSRDDPDFVTPEVIERLPKVSAKSQWEGDYELDADELEAMVATYDGGIRYVDSKLEAWLQDLEDAGWLKDALLIVTADHGEALGQRNGHLGHGGDYQEGLHIPLLIRHPSGLRAGERVSQPVHQADLVPTILDFAGLPMAAQLPGHSLLGQLPEKRVLTGSRQLSTYLLDWPRKAVVFRGLPRGFNLERDPSEVHPIMLPTEEFKELQRRLEDSLPQESFPAPVPQKPIDPSIAEELDALGYGGGEDG